MNCYSGLANRFIKSCFPRIIPVPQLQPLDARNIIKQDVTDISTNKPILDEEAREAAFTCRRCAKTKEKEKTLLLKMLLSQTDTDESYDSDDSECGVPTYPVRKSALFANEDDEYIDKTEELVRSIIARWVTISKKWHAATMIQAYERGRAVRSGGADFFIATQYAYNEPWRRQCWWVTTHTVTRTALAMYTLWNVEKRAATIIQAAARGRAVRAWNPFISASSASQTDADEYYDSDDTTSASSWDVVAMGVTGLMKTRAVGLVEAVVECHAATIIQATARGRAVRLSALDAALLMRLRKERRRATKETRRAWNAALDPTTWYRV